MENRAQKFVGSRRAGKKLALAACAAFACLASAEFVVRIAVCSRAGSARLLFASVIWCQNIEKPDPVLNHVLVPGANFTHTGTPPGSEFCVNSRINSRGMHDREPSDPASTGIVRVLVLGDSFVEARQVPIEANFCKRIERRLAADLGNRVEVLNGGVSSYSPILEYLAYKTKFREFHPRVVVLAFFANDVFDDIRYSLVGQCDTDGNPLAVPADRFPWFRVLEGDEAGKSVEYRMALSRIVYSRPRGLSSVSYIAAWIERAVALVRLRGRFPDPPRNEEFFILESSFAKSAVAEHGWQLSARYLALLKRECNRDGASLLLTAVPIAAQVAGGSSYDHFFFSGKPNLSDQEGIRRIAGELGVEFVDLMPALKAGGSKMYLPRDGHWTRAGHEVAASALYPALLAACRKAYPSSPAEKADD